MANPERGEIALVVKGDPERGTPDREYTLKLSVNAAATLERRLKKTIGQLLAEASGLSFDSIRYVTWLLLQKYHAAEFKTEEKAGDFIDDAGGVASMFAKLQELAAINDPKGKEAKGDAPADPPTAQGADDGPGSTSKPDASA